jgi:hypothetical protein
MIIVDGEESLKESGINLFFRLLKLPIEALL